MKGYKVFNPDWTCRDFQYKVGETFRHEGKIKVCKEGFHFCKNLSDCFSYYQFDSKNKVAEIEATGNVLEDVEKCVTDEITIVKELSWHEVLDLVNVGRNNTGRCNTGDYNTGHWNSCSYSTGFFNSVSLPVYAFNKPLNVSREEFLLCDGMKVINKYFCLCQWTYESSMTEDEKEKNPEYKTMGGYLKTFDFRTACKEMWKKLTLEEKQKVCGIPNFDASVFQEITGIDVNLDRTAK